MQYSAIPCLFAMAHTIAGERYGQTLGIVLATPARRLPLFLGRSLPVVANGFVVSMFSLVVGALVLGVHIPARPGCRSRWSSPSRAASCTGFGLVNAALALRVREIAVLTNVLFGVLLIFCGVNVALDSLPGWMAAVGRLLPLTHAIEAARELAAGASLGSVSGLVGTELLVGLVYARDRPGRARAARGRGPPAGHPRDAVAAQRPWFATALIASAAASGSRYSPPGCVGCRCSSSR